MPNNIMNFGPTRTTSTAKRFAAVQARRGGSSVSKALVRALVALFLVALTALSVLLFVRVYRVPAAPAAPAMGQWSLVKDEEVAIVRRAPPPAAAAAAEEQAPAKGLRGVERAAKEEPAEEPEEEEEEAAEGEGDEAAEGGDEAKRDAEGKRDGEGANAAAAAAAAAAVAEAPPVAGEPGTTVVVTTVPRRPRKIVLSTSDGKINTGVWPNWGQGTDEVTLNWAAAGVRVRKQCPTKCIVTHDQAELADADAVMVEPVNWPKFGNGGDFPFPAKRGGNPKLLLPGPQPTAIPARVPLTGLFYYEAAQSWPRFTLPDEKMVAGADFSLAPSMESTLPITLICPWGHPTERFLRVPARADKKPGRLVAYFNEHGVSPQYTAFVNELFTAAGDGIHAYQNRKNRALPPEADIQPYQLSNRLEFLATYKFALVTEAISERDFIEPEYSHAVVAGAVPIYIGAPNIGEFVAGPRAMVHGRDFATAAALWEYLQTFADVKGDAAADAAAWERYSEFHAWKKGAWDAYMRDEQGQGFALGTGQGVSRAIVPAGERVPRIEAFAAKPGPDGAVVPLAELVKAAGGDEPFNALAADAWRAFRRHLDHCVHYAECRVCELVTLLT